MPTGKTYKNTSDPERSGGKSIRKVIPKKWPETIIKTDSSDEEVSWKSAYEMPSKFKKLDYGKCIVKNYHEIVLLGEGSFGKAYKVIDTVNREYYVVKKIRKRKSKKGKLMEQNEVSNMSILKENCAEYFACFVESIETEKYLYVVMEFLADYVTIDSIMSEMRKKIHSNDYKAIVSFQTMSSNMCEGLKLMHSFGIAHNDIKPANILVNPKTYDIKFIDFGTSCYKEDCQSMTSFTLAYVDPKFLKENGKHILLSLLNNKYLRRAQQADLWSLGCTFYEIITGTLPITYYSTCDEYVEHYKYKKDRRKNEIENFLTSIPECNLSLEKLLTRKTRVL